MVSEMLTWVKWNNEEAPSSRKLSENILSELPNGSWTHDLSEYRSDTLTTELWRTHGEQGSKLSSYGGTCAAKLQDSNMLKW